MLFLQTIQQKYPTGSSAQEKNSLDEDRNTATQMRTVQTDVVPHPHINVTGAGQANLGMGEYSSTITGSAQEKQSLTEDRNSTAEMRTPEVARDAKSEEENAANSEGGGGAASWRREPQMIRDSEASQESGAGRGGAKSMPELGWWETVKVLPEATRPQQRPRS